MVYVPSGTLHIGPSDQDVSNTFVQRQRSISIQGFYMDDTEVTNNEYRQFVYWVRDSLAHSYLDHFIEDEVTGDQRIDWEYKIDWEDETLQDLYYQGDDRFAGRLEYDVDKFWFEYEWYDWQGAAHDDHRGHDRNNRGKERTSFIKKKTVKIIPYIGVGTRLFLLVQRADGRDYFHHPAFDDYPVVGVDWHMANAFSYWRTKLWNTYEAEKNGANSEDFRLPTEFEWELGGSRRSRPRSVSLGRCLCSQCQGLPSGQLQAWPRQLSRRWRSYTVKADAYFPKRLRPLQHGRQRC